MGIAICMMLDFQSLRSYLCCGDGGELFMDHRGIMAWSILHKLERVSNCR